MSHHEVEPVGQRWARLRFSIIGNLLASPPAGGRLQQALQGLADKQWVHPISGKPVRFGRSTIERWYYRARQSSDPIGALRPRARADTGRERQFPEALKQALQRQYEQHKGWSYQLHVDNLRALVQQQPELGPMPSYSTANRYMKANGLYKQRRIQRRDTERAQAAEQRLQSREVRSYEVDYVHGLWHMRSSRLCGVNGG